MPALHATSRLLALALLISVRSAWGADAPPRLEGIVVGPRERLAIFVERTGEHRMALLREGDSIGSFTVQTIGSEKVVVVGPAGAETLETEPDADRPGLAATTAATPGVSPLQVVIVSDGVMIGRLAMRRDNCVRSGLLPGVRIDAEARLRAMISAMAQLPTRDGAAGTHDAPVKLMASTLSAGLEAARRQAPDRKIDVSACAQVKALWAQFAGRFGLL